MHISSVHCAVIDANRIQIDIRFIWANNNVTAWTYLHRVCKQVSELTSFNAVNIEIDEVKVIRVSIQYVSVLLRTNHESQSNTHTIICIHCLHIRIALTTSCEHNRRRLNFQSNIPLLIRHSDGDALCIVIRGIINLIVYLYSFTALRCFLLKRLVIDSKAWTREQAQCACTLIISYPTVSRESHILPLRTDMIWVDKIAEDIAVGIGVVSVLSIQIEHRSSRSRVTLWVIHREWNCITQTHLVCWVSTESD